MGIYLFSLFTSISTLFLLLVGGTVNPTGSSLACPDWPTCHGTFFPKMVGGVFYEHSHRLVATTVGALVVILTLWIWRKYKDQFLLRALSLSALILVIFQGILGGMTVLLKLPPAISIAHLGISMVFFCLMITISFQLKQQNKVAKLNMTAGANISNVSVYGHRGWVLMATFLIYGQILLGAFVRHLHAGRICGTEFPLCSGMIWPPDALGRLHMFHRFFAFVLMAFLCWVSFKVVKYAKQNKLKFSKVMGLHLPLLTLIQIFLGIMTVATNIKMHPAATHLAMGAMLLACSWLLYLSLGGQRVSHDA